MESKAASFGSPTSLAGSKPGTLPPARGRAWRAPWLVAGLLALVLAGDRGAWTATNNGVDPLDILDLTVKNNVLFIVDTSGSMTWTGDADTYVGTDDPGSRIYQAKQAVKQVVTAQNGKINMGLLTYNVLSPDKSVSSGAGLTYVSADANASDWDTLFNGPSTTFTNYDAATTSTEVFKSFRSYSSITDSETGQTGVYSNNNNAGDHGYPQGCSYTSTTYEPIDFTTPANTHCRHYLQSQLYRSNAIITWDRSLTTTGWQSMTTIPGGCPLPPANLLGENDGTKAAPCIQLKDKASSRVTTFYYSGLTFHNNVGADCGGAGRIANVAPCDDPTGALNNAVVTTITDAMAPAVPVVGGQLDFGTGLDAALVDGSATGTLGTAKDIHALNPAVRGLRPGQSTPLAGSLNDVRTASPAFFPTRPAAASGLQKNFVILITDGDDTCAGGSSNDANAVLAAKAAEDLFYNTKGVAPAGYSVEPSDPTHQAETILVAFGKAVTPARANVIGQGGSGAVITVGSSPTTAAACPTGVVCRNAFQAADTAGLVRVLNDAIAIAAATGRFSASPSVTGSVFEYVNFVSGNSPLAPTQRYNFDVPVLLQSQFEMPGFKGHFKAFADFTAAQCTAAGGTLETITTTPLVTTCLLWDGGQTILDRIILARSGASCTATQPDCMFPDNGVVSDSAKTSDYTFSQLYGGAVMASAGTANDLRIKRRIFTTSANGVGPGTAALWPPDTTATGVDPGDPSPLAAGTRNPAGPFDAAMGLNSLTLAQLGTNFGACIGALPATHPCVVTPVVTANQLRAAVREAREVILAHLAGAEISQTTASVPKRDASGNLYYHARSWVLAESSLSTPAIMTPVSDRPTDNEKQEWTLYRDGPRDASTKKSVNEISLGYGLRNPDKDGDVTGGNAASDLNIKPPMTLVLLGANDGLHAFRAGPCNASGTTVTFNNCNGASFTEKGGQELWSMVPFDQLGKLPSLLQAQTRAAKTYVVSAGLRFGDIYVPAPFTDTGDGKPYNGRWKRALFFGRGIAGKSLSALDMTVTGPFTKDSLSVPLPTVLWNRGNPDTSDGVALATCGSTCNNNTSAAQHDYDAYKTMGESWSVPALARVNVKDAGGVDRNKTVRKPAPGGVTFMLYSGSGYTDVDTEGSTFYALDALTGDVVHSKDIGDRSAASAGVPANLNVIVASPSAFAQNLLVPGTSIPNLANEITTRVYVADVHGRLWRFYTDDTDFSRTLPTAPFADLGDGQAVTKGAALLFYDTTGTAGKKPVIYVNAGGDKRVLPTTSRPFKGFGFAEESDGTATQLFTFDWAATPAPGFRGTIQPTTAFTTGGLGRVFYVATRLNPPGANCLSTFTSRIAALGAGSGAAAYNMGTADDRFLPDIPVRIVTPITTDGGKPGYGTGDRIATDPPPPPPPQPKGTNGVSVYPPAGPAGAPVFRTLSSVCK